MKLGVCGHDVTLALNFVCMCVCYMTVMGESF